MARVQQKKHAAVTTGSTGSSGLPCAMVLTVSFALSPGTGLCCPRRHAKRASRNLTSASGCQDHTTSPSASASFVRTDQSARVAIASIAARLTFGDDWPSRPSCIEAGWRDKIMQFRKTEEKYFFATRLDGRINPAPRCEHSFFFAHAVLARRPALHRPQHPQTSARAGESLRVLDGDVVVDRSHSLVMPGLAACANKLRRAPLLCRVAAEGEDRCRASTS
jgi:hypothetical protein